LQAFPICARVVVVSHLCCDLDFLAASDEPICVGIRGFLLSSAGLRGCWRERLYPVRVAYYDCARIAFSAPQLSDPYYPCAILACSASCKACPTKFLSADIWSAVCARARNFGAAISGDGRLSSPDLPGHIDVPRRPPLLAGARTFVARIRAYAAFVLPQRALAADLLCL
jgi:hypothetical protein